MLSGAAPSGTILSFSYSFDQDSSPSLVKNNGNVVQIVNNRDTGRTQSFTYDELNRIATAQSQATSGANCWGNSFAYDVWANLLSKTVTKCTAESLSVTISTKNQITNAGFTYDAAGNLTNSGAGVMTYDAENRLTNAAGVTYTYDGDGKRVKKSNGKLYWTGTGSDPLLETDLAGNSPTEFIFFNGKRTARRDPSGTIEYYFSDHLGSASVVTNATGTIVEESDYYPFGGERVIVGGDPNQYKFTGKERDAESGLDYFGARSYSALLARFATPDPSYRAVWLRIPQTWHGYSYVYNNPLRFADPDGAAPLDTINILHSVLDRTSRLPVSPVDDPRAVVKQKVARSLYKGLPGAGEVILGGAIAYASIQAGGPLGWGVATGVGGGLVASGFEQIRGAGTGGPSFLPDPRPRGCPILSRSLRKGGWVSVPPSEQIPRLS